MIMKTPVFRVVSQGVVTYVPSTKEDSGQLAKCVIRLKELGGKYENEYACTMFGNSALGKFYEGEVVMAALRFQVHESNGNLYQDVTVKDILKLNNSF